MRPFLLALAFLLFAPPALAGPNEGGVLVLHATTLEYTVDVDTYMGMSGVACGQDGPPSPQAQECPPYDPVGGAVPCNPLAFVSISTMPAEVAHVWYVLAAFPPGSCPRLKGVGFRIHYDPNKVMVEADGPSDEMVSVPVPVPSDEDNREFPSNRSGIGLGFTEARTSLLQEIWWFAGYAYGGAPGATFAVEPLAGSESFNDDSNPRVLDQIEGFGVLSFEPGAPPSPTGSCCYPDGSCAITSQPSCAGDWTLSGTCDPNLCPAPDVECACCSLQATCTLTVRTECLPPHQWHAAWPACDPNPCPIPEGACCTLDGACKISTQADCDPSSIWHGDLTSCVPNPCPAMPADRTSWGQVKSRYR